MRPQNAREKPKVVVLWLCPPTTTFLVHGIVSADDDGGERGGFSAFTCDWRLRGLVVKVHFSEPGSRQFLVTDRGARLTCYCSVHNRVLASLVISDCRSGLPDEDRMDPRR